MRTKGLMKSLLCGAMVLLLGSSSFGDGKDAVYADDMDAYVQMQRIIQILSESKKAVFKKNEKDRTVTWNAAIEKLRAEAEKNRCNKKRLELLAVFLGKISQLYGNDFKDLDSEIENIDSKCIQEAATEGDFFFALAICIRLNIMLNDFSTFSIPVSTRNAAKAALQRCKDELVRKIKEQYDNGRLKKLVAEYQKLFPDQELVIDRVPPQSYDDCVKGYQEAMANFWNLDKCSANADFREWGKCMLNVLIYNQSSMFVDEFEKSMKNYTQAFEQKKK